MKRVTVLFAALIITGTMSAQFHIGPQIGYSASNLTVNFDSITNSLKNNFLVGVFMRFGNKVYVAPEVNYLTQGSVFKYPSFGSLSPLEQNIKLQTLQIPVNVGWRIINLKVVNIRIFGGIVANFILNTTISNSGGDPDYYEEALVPDDFRNVQWQWDVGAGVDIFMFAVDIKYMGGINNILKDISFDGTTVYSKSNLFVVTVGWKIF